MARHLVSGEIGLAVRDELVAGNFRARPKLDEGARRFAPLVVRLRYHGGGLHGGMLVERVLHLDRRDVLAARDYDVLGAVLELDVAVGMRHAEIAGVKPAAL